MVGQHSAVLIMRARCEVEIAFYSDDEQNVTKFKQGGGDTASLIVGALLTADSEIKLPAFQTSNQRHSCEIAFPSI